MKMRFFNLASVLLLAALSTFAQSSNNEDEVIKIAQYAGREYCEGEMIVKFKSSSAVRVQSVTRGVRAGVNKVDEVFGELGVTAGEQLMPLTGAVVSRTRAVRSLSGKIVEDVDLSQLYCLRFDESKTDMLDAIEKISALDEVEYAEPNYIVRTQTVGEGSEVYDTAEEVAAYQAEPLYSQQWGLPAINMPQLWAQPKITSKRPVIAILDTGVDTTHPDLVDNLWVNTAEAEGEDYVDDDGNGYVDDVHGWDIIRGRGATDDPYGHGTHCAGIAAAVGNNGIGIAGANPDALIMSVRVLNQDGIGTEATVIRGIDYAIANGGDVISMSLGGHLYSLAEHEACKKAFQTAILVAASGNFGCNIDCLSAAHPGRMFPGAFDVVIGVQASDAYGNRASFSNYDHDGGFYTNYDVHGDNFFNYEVYAPGVDILSTYPGGKYKYLNGTSMATPFVAGVVSRLLQTRERERYLGTLVGDIVHACDESTGVLDAYRAHLFDNTNRQLEVVIQSVEISDAEAGDNDGSPESGEIIDLYPTVRCVWGNTSDVKLSVEVDPIWDKNSAIEVISNEVDLGYTLNSQSSAKSKNPIRIKLNENFANNYNLRLIIRVNTGDYEQKKQIEFFVKKSGRLAGVITEDMTLTPEKEYIVDSNFGVPAGVTLTILPGTTLKFTTGARMKIEGHIICNGTPENPIYFTTDLKSDFIDGMYFNAQGTRIDIGYNKISYVIIDGIYGSGIDQTTFNSYPFLEAAYNGEYLGLFTNCIIRNCYITGFFSWTLPFDKCTIYNNKNPEGGSFHIERDYPPHFKNTNMIENSTFLDDRFESVESCNVFNNNDGVISKNLSFNSSGMNTYSNDFPIYFGTGIENIARIGIYDSKHPFSPIGWGTYDLSNMLTRPVAEAHGIVWKVVVNGYDAQDEFDQLPPLGVGRHKFEIYFNRPMDTRVTPTVRMGAAEPYDQIAIEEEGSWNDDGTIYTVYLTIDGKTNADGLNRIYVADAVEAFDYYYIRKELESLVSKTDSLLQETGTAIGKAAISDNELNEMQRNTLATKQLCIDEVQDATVLQAALDQTYTYYNQLAEILEHPSIEQTPINVPLAPEWAVPVENRRFNVMVAATGSLSTGLMAQAGLGKVTLTWETDEEDFEDLLGYNIYRYTETPDSVSVIDYEKYNDYNYHWEYFTRRDTIRVNQTTIESHEQQLVDYDVEPGITYYYYITQMTTSMNSYNLSNVVAATPLTAKKGDANGSMNVDIADVVTEVAYITYQDPQPFIFEAADVNSDQKVNVLDVVGTIGIITTPAEIGVSGIDNEPVRYYVQDGVLYMENTQPLGGVQVRLGVAKGTAITALEALTGMEQTSVWTSDSEYLFLAYSMSGRSLAPGTHALLQIGAEAIVTEVVISDTKGKNITAVNGDATGIGKVEAVQLQMPAPNPFTTVLNVPYIIGKSGSHEVTISFCDLAGRTIDAYHTVNTMGEYTYTWYPKSLQKGLYLVNLYVDGELMQTAKVICNN